MYLAFYSMGSVIDFLTDKFLSYSEKMKESSKVNGISFLMNGNSNFHPQLLYPADLLLNVPRGNDIYNIETTDALMMPLKQPLGLFSTNYSSSFLNTEKPFSSHLCKFVMDAYRYRYGSSDKPCLLPCNMVFSHLMDNLLFNQSEMNRSITSGFNIKETFITAVSESNMPKTVSHPPPKKKSEITNNKCSVPNSITLNLELASRKTKEMNKRSKKRRRRQKKIQLFDGNNSSTSISDDNADSKVTTPVSSCVCLSSDSSEFECTMCISHSVRMSPNISSFLVSVGSASDDSEWESYEDDQYDISASHKKADDNILLNPISSRTESEIANSKCFKSAQCDYQKTASFISSFVVPIESSSDDDSDWDSCETTDIFNETPDLGFTTLLLTNLCTSQTLSSHADTIITISCEDEDNETIKLRALLQEVNKKWNEYTKGVNARPKSPSKVSFAPDKALVEVFPVDIYERKGEWEIYATERLRFKRRIDELEKVLSPCLNPEHRGKVFKKLIESTL